MANSVGVVGEEDESGVVGVVAGGFWLESGVEGEGGMDVPPASSSSSSCGDDSLAL